MPVDNVQRIKKQLDTVVDRLIGCAMHRDVLKVVEGCSEKPPGLRRLYTVKVQRIVARVLLLVCVGLPPLHSWAVDPDNDYFSSIPGIPSPAHDRQVNLLSQASETREMPDGQPAPTTPSIPHCDFEVSPIDHPPLCLFGPPESVRARNDQLAPSPLSFTIDPVSPPPRQA